MWARRMMACVVCGIFAVSVVWAERISPEDAAVVANNFMNVASASAGVKKAPAKRMVMKAAASEQTEETQYYIYENADGEGWVMVAANDAVNPILAFSETGHFRTDNMPVNLKGWLGKYNKFIKKIEEDGVEATPEAAAEWGKLRNGAKRLATAGSVVVGPLIQTTWDQDSPYWNLCPGSGSSKAYTGCVATAMAQVMNYWQWPKQGVGSRTYQPLNPNNGRTSTRYSQQTANFGATTYDWENMKNSYSGSYSDAEATAVATLMFHCGVATCMMYGNSSDGGSGTYTVNYGDWDWSDDSPNMDCAQNALYRYFDYKQATGYMRSGYTEDGYTYYEAWTDDAWTAMIKAELDLQHPIMYAGAGNEGALFGIAHAHTEALGDVGGNVERAVVKQLVGHLDHGAQLVGGQRGLGELRVGLGDRFALVNPGGFHHVIGDGNLPGTGSGTDHMGHAAEDVVLLQAVNQLALEFIRNGISALGILADGQGVAHFRCNRAAHHIPEGGPILVGGRPGGLLGKILRGHADHSLACGLCQLRIDHRLVLQALDFRAERLYIGAHLLVLLNGGSFHEAVLIAVFLQEGLRLFPERIALVAQFHDLIHALPLSPA